MNLSTKILNKPIDSKSIVQLTTSIDLAERSGACKPGLKKAISFLGSDWPKDEPIVLSEFIEKYPSIWQDIMWLFDHLESFPIEERASVVCQARLFACDYVEMILPIWEVRYPEDNRPRLAIDAARNFVLGKISQEELNLAIAGVWLIVLNTDTPIKPWSEEWVAARAWAAASGRYAGMLPIKEIMARFKEYLG